MNKNLNNASTSLIGPKKAKFLGLDDTNTYKQFNVLKFIERNEKSFELIYQLESFNIYKVLNINN